RDHPRVRGEHHASPSGRVLAPGPSPRARGARGSGGLLLLGLGTIPACAGSTMRSVPTTSECGDHPRVRGEHTILEHVFANDTGPSPRARGALDEASVLLQDLGTIPA